MYNMTNVTDANSYWGQVVAVNDLSGGLIGIFILFALFLIIFAVFKKFEEDTKQVLLVDSTIITVVAVLSWAAELIEWKILIFPIILMFASLIIYKFSR